VVVAEEWAFPGLGFDPLPGNPQVARDLENDARIFGQRMCEQATELRRLAWKDGWQGEAAEVFSQHLKTLPRDLERCGEAFSGLADALASYAAAFEFARRTAVTDLERRAVEARQKIQTADAAFHTPVISARDDCAPSPDRKLLDDAQDELGAILREAHDFADKFNDSADVQHLEHVIRKVLTHYAPDEPGWNVLKHWAGNVFQATPVGAAINAAHEVINRYPEFFNHLAGFLSELSGVVGLIGLPAMFFPPLGTAIGVAVLGLTAASAGIKTSLYVGHARDANGNLIVSGGNLIHSYVDVALSAGAVGATAVADRAVALSRGQAEEATFGKQLAKQFSKKELAKGLAAPKRVIAGSLEEAGRAAAENAAREGVEKSVWKGAAKLIAKQGASTFAKTTPGYAWNRAGLVVGGVGPAANSPDRSNIFGWRSVERLPHEAVGFLDRDPETPDLQLRTAPTMSNPKSPQPTVGPYNGQLR